MTTSGWPTWFQTQKTRPGTETTCIQLQTTATDVPNTVVTVDLPPEMFGLRLDDSDVESHGMKNFGSHSDSEIDGDAKAETISSKTRYLPSGSPEDV